MSIFEYKKKNKRAFTLVEVMLLLVVLSLIIASSTAVITRKYKLKPKRAVHGQYICYYDTEAEGGAKKHEILVSGTNEIKNQTLPQETPCTFEIPRSASYIHVRMLGGGGAGGNANYLPNDYPKHSSENINLVRSFDNSKLVTQTRGTLPKIHDGNSVNDSSPGYSEEVKMGVSEDYVNKKFENLLTSNLFKHFVNDKIVDKVFAYDYAGDGQTGGGITYNYMDYSNYGCMLSSEEFSNSFSTCYDHYVGSSYYLSETCVSEKGSARYCPSFYLFYVPANGGEVKTWFGGLGGRGTIFTTTGIDWEYDTYPVVGWRWPDYHTFKTSKDTSIDTTINLGTRMCDRFAEPTYEIDKVIDWWRCSYYVEQDVHPIHTSDAVKAGAITKCPDDASADKCRDGYLKDGSYELTNKGGAGVKFDKVPRFDDTEIKFVTQQGNDVTHIIPYTKPIHDGKLPYFDKNVGHGGVKLMYAGGTTGVQSSGGFTSGSSPAGRAGTSLKPTFDTMYEADGTAKDAPFVPAGADGGTSLKDPEQTACISNLGIKLKNRYIFYTLNSGSGSNPKACQDTNEYGSDSVPSWNSTYVKAFSNESTMGIRMYLKYYDKAISYGAAGQAGGYSEFFTRSYRSNTLHIIPGAAGIARPVGQDMGNSVPPTEVQNGKASLIYYNCDYTGKNCASRAVRGGSGGASGLWEEAISLQYTPQEIKSILNRTYGDIVHCSFHAPDEEGCNDSTRTNSAPSKRFGGRSGFSAIASLLSLPPIPHFEDLGKGGDAGWVVEKCWVKPQFFVIRDGSWAATNWPKAKKEDTELESGFSYGAYDVIMQNYTSLANDEGYTYISKSDVDNICTTFPDGNTYKETGGTDGMPGAVIITW